MSADLLDQPHLSVLGRSDDPELRRIQQTIAHPILVDGRSELEARLCELLAHGRRGAPKTLDLIGHSTAHTSLLAVGDWVIDASSTTITAFFRELAEQNVLFRLGIEAVRLLGCLTADTAHGKWTVCALADILGVEVYGTTGPLLSSHYARDGFSDDRRYVLASASQLRSNAFVSEPVDRGWPSDRVLDIDALPAVALQAPRWPVHVLDAEQARELLYLVRRRDGSTIPGLVAPPSCELALPSARAGHYHMIQVLLDGELVRVYPPGAEHGIVYPVDDPFTFRQLVEYAGRT